MKIICAKCMTASELENLVPMEAAEGISYHCPACEAPNAYATYAELEALPEDVEVVFLANQQLDYLRHLVVKQIGKVEAAADQLYDTLEALQGEK